MLVVATPAAATNLVRVDTICNVTPGATGLTIGVYVENDVPILGLVVPLELRSVSGGAFIASGAFSWSLNTAGRVYNSPLGPTYPPGCDHDGDPSDCFWPSASLTVSKFSDPVATNHCSGPVSSTWTTATSNPDFVSPDAVFFASVSMGDTARGQMIFLTPGADPGTTPSLRIICNVNSNDGVFVIDTCCRTHGSHLSYAAPDEDGSGYVLVIPMFHQGTIAISSTDPCQCRCSCHANPVCDSTMNILDVVAIIDVAFRGGESINDPEQFCPHPPADLNCDSAIDIVDAVKSINVAFRDVEPAVEICDPCAN